MKNLKFFIVSILLKNALKGKDMRVEYILGNLSDEKSSLSDKEKIAVKFEWFETDKKRIKKRAADGQEFGIIPNKILEDGDIIAQIENKIYFCSIQDCLLTKIEVANIEEMGKLCFEIGNRHISLKIRGNCVYIPYDKPTFDYLEKLKFSPVKVEEIFSNFTRCNAHALMPLAASGLTLSFTQ